MLGLTLVRLFALLEVVFDRLIVANDEVDKVLFANAKPKNQV